jgi:hypothetical protein
MTEQYQLDIINQKLDALDMVISRLQEGVASFEWTKDEPDDRAEELVDFIEQRDALIEKRNTLE